MWRALVHPLATDKDDDQATYLHAHTWRPLPLPALALRPVAVVFLLRVEGATETAALLRVVRAGAVSSMSPAPEAAVRVLRVLVVCMGASMASLAPRVLRRVATMVGSCCVVVVWVCE